jgi:type VI secretion system protein ImpG
MDGRLRHYFTEELQALREGAAEFGKANDKTAQALAMTEGNSRDPHVEVLLESFAFLTGRLRHQVDEDEALLPNALLGHLYPHLEAPVPSMLVARVEVKGDPDVLERHRLFYADTIRKSEPLPTECRFRNCYRTPLWPLEIADVRLAAVNHYEELGRDPLVHSALRVRVRRTGGDPIGAMKLDRLRFYLDAENPYATRLYDWLAVDRIGMAVQIPGQDGIRRIDNAHFRWLGFEDDEAALPQAQGTHPGYRIVQEYFAFPEKFFFFEVAGLNLAGAGDAFDLHFLLKAPPEKDLEVGCDALMLNCLPLVNLYPRRLEPLALDQTEYEYRLVADRQHHEHCEIHQVTRLEAMRPDASPRPLYPCFALDDFAQLAKQDYFHVLRRGDSPLHGVPGTETYVSFVDPAFDPTQPADQVIGGYALCTNRRLPEQLQRNDALHMEGPGPVKAITVVSKPTPHQTPPLQGARPWALVSQLVLNHLSLSEGENALSALKAMLRLHVGRANAVAVKQIDNLVRVVCRPIVRHLGREGWRGFVTGLHVHLEMGSRNGMQGSQVLFAEVLRRFLALYASVNTIVEVSMETPDAKGNLKEWPPLAGAHTLL